MSTSNKMTAGGGDPTGRGRPGAPGAQKSVGAGRLLLPAVFLLLIGGFYVIRLMY